MIKSTGIDFFTFYATTGAEKCNHQLVVATTGAFTLTSVIMIYAYKTQDIASCKTLVKLLKLGQIEKINVFRVTGLKNLGRVGTHEGFFLNIFFPFKMHEIIFFSRKPEKILAFTTKFR